MDIPITIAPDNIERGISMIIYSDAGQGKTTMASTLPVGETLIIQIEAGYGPLIGTGHHMVDIKKIIANSGNNIEDIMTELYRRLRTREINSYRYIVIDNISELIQCLLQHYTESRKKNFPDRTEQGDTSYKVMEWFNNWRDLVDIGINVIFMAWEQNVEIQKTDGSTITKTCPTIGKNTCFRACGLVDAVGRLEVIEETNQRWVRFGPSEQYLTKCQFKGLVSPDNLVGGHPANLTDIITKIKECYPKQKTVFIAIQSITTPPPTPTEKKK